MTSYSPATQSYNFNHMVSFVDYRPAVGDEPKPCVEKNSIYHYLEANPQFSKFKRIVDKAGMLGFLSNSQANFTVFVPMDKYLTQIPEEFFKNMDIGLAKQIVKASCVDRKIDASLLVSNPVCYYNTKNPEMRLYITNIRNKTRINNCVSVVEYNVNLSNGMIHLIDGLIVPTFDTFMN